MSQSTPQQRLQEAQKHLKAGQKDEATEILKALLKENPKIAGGWWLLSHSSRNPEEIRLALKRVLALKPDHEGANQRLAKLEAQLTAHGKSKKASTKSSEKSSSLPLILAGMLCLVLIIGGGALLFSQLNQSPGSNPPPTIDNTTPDAAGIASTGIAQNADSTTNENTATPEVRATLPPTATATISATATPESSPTPETPPGFIAVPGFTGVCDASLPAEECEEVETAITSPLNSSYIVQILFSLGNATGDLASNTNILGIEGEIELDEAGRIQRADLRLQEGIEVQVMFGSGTTRVVAEWRFYMDEERIYVGEVDAVSDEITWFHVDRDDPALANLTLSFDTVFPTVYLAALETDKTWVRLNDANDQDGTPIHGYRFNFTDTNPLATNFSMILPFAVDDGTQGESNPFVSVFSGLFSAGLAATFDSAIVEYLGYVGVNADTGEMDQFITRQTTIVDTSRPPNPSLSSEPSIFDFDVEGMFNTDAEIEYRLSVNFNPYNSRFLSSNPQNSQPMDRELVEYLGELGSRGAVEMLIGYMLSVKLGVFPLF